MSAASVPWPSEPTPEGLRDAFASYERALMTDDLDALDRLFAPGAATLRGDAAGLLVGHDQISRFRGGRGGAPARTLVEVHVQVVDDAHATVVAVTALARGGRGLQTQTWERQPRGWVVTAAHVSVPPPAVDARVWRVVGTPLVPGGAGPLQGARVAVKDLYAVAGQRVGAGNPTWLAEAPVEPEHAWAVARLLEAGAEVAGLAQTDELAYSLAGTNAHSGTPPNPQAPGRISGGSSSGSASAVSLGQAGIGLGTDTGGSIRVPAAYQGLWGIRTTHNLVPRAGLLPLAPSFDSVGWLTRDVTTLGTVGEVLLPPAAADEPGLSTEDLVVVPELVDLAEPDVAAAVRSTTEHLEPLAWRPAVGPWLEAFSTLQAWEAWQTHGAWLEGRLEVLGPDVRGRFQRARDTTDAEAETARTVVRQAREEICEVVGDRVLVLPSTSTTAPELGPSLADRLQRVREATMRLTCVAGLGGLPAVSMPRRTPTGVPAGVCLVAGPGRDRALLGLAAELAAGLGTGSG